jgi:hypothetical protein
MNQIDSGPRRRPHCHFESVVSDESADLKKMALTEVAPQQTQNLFARHAFWHWGSFASA